MKGFLKVVLWHSETLCVLVDFLSFLHSLQSRAEKTISHRKAVRSIFSCLNTDQNVTFPVVNWWAWIPDDNSISHSGLGSSSQGHSLCSLTSTLLSRPPLLTDLGPGGLFF